MKLLARIRKHLADYRLSPKLPWGLLDPRKRKPAVVEEWVRINREERVRRGEIGTVSAYTAFWFIVISLALLMSWLGTKIPRG